MRNRRWVLARRPEGLVSADDFRLEEVAVPTPGRGSSSSARII
jgi:NADPH-dependent curcumin reductase CurA